MNMKSEPFQSNFSDYLSAIREAKDKEASHDYLRTVDLPPAIIPLVKLVP